ncbi:hypothetical protein HUW63_08275 [Myxococcus sp. AM001]|nr:hypothetical protein [Myxococcus sp. AM001]
MAIGRDLEQYLNQININTTRAMERRKQWGDIHKTVKERLERLVSTTTAKVTASASISAGLVVQDATTGTGAPVIVVKFATLPTGRGIHRKNEFIAEVVHGARLLFMPEITGLIGVGFDGFTVDYGGGQNSQNSPSLSKWYEPNALEDSVLLHDLMDEFMHQALNSHWATTERL